jgi:tRNA pseudouridine55 synthase
VVGRATRLASLFSGAEKEYDAGVRLGLATDTYDAAHRSGPVPEAPPGIGADTIEAALEEFRGTYMQAPPAFSAKKINGVAAYKLARRNEPVQPKAVTVTVHRLTLLAYENGMAQLRVHCSAGFYVRSLAHDLGARLGCGAHLESLRRIRAGSFDESAAVPLAAVESEGPGSSRRLVPLSLLLPHLPCVVLNARGVRRATHGNDVTSADLEASQTSGIASESEDRWRLLDGAGTLLGIAQRSPVGLLHPVIVLV